MERVDIATDRISRLATMAYPPSTAAVRHFTAGGPLGGGGPHGIPLRLGTRSRHGRRAPRGEPLHGGRQRQIRGSVPSHRARYWKFESISLQHTVRLSPNFTAFQEKPRFSAILAATASGRVARDTAEPSNLQKGALVSPSADIPVPQCCPTRLATLAALAAREVKLATLCSFEFGSAYAKSSKVR